MPAPEPLIAERYARFAGHRTRVLSVTGTGPPLLFLHGFTDSADTWRPVLRLLAWHGRAGMAVDLPSHGRADPADERRPMLPQLTEFAEAAVEPGTVLVGNSLGGLIGLLLAERSAALGGVVAVCPAGLGYSTRMLAASAQLRSPVRRRIVATALGLPPVCITYGAVRVSIGRAWGSRAHVDRRFAPAYAAHIAPRIARRRLLTMLYGLREEALISPLRPERIRCPAMVVWGAQDPLTPPSAGRSVIDGLAGVRSEVWAGIGHMPQLETPAHLVEILNDFISDQHRGAGRGSA